MSRYLSVRSLLAAATVALVAMLSIAATASAELTTPRLTAKAAILIEPSTGEVLYLRSPDKRLPIASTTKMMTALLVVENLSLNDTLRASTYQAAAAETKLGLRPGERMKVADLLRGMLLVSANDAAVTLAKGVSGSVPAFVKQMNRRAKELGLENTHFSTPVGLDTPGNYSTARDLVKIATVLRKQAFLRKTVNQPTATLRSGDHLRRVSNRNTLLSSSPEVNGVKTGHTFDAGYVLVASATRNGVTLVSAVLGEPSESARNVDTLALLKYGFKNFKIFKPVTAGERWGSVAVEYYGPDSKVDLVAAKGVTTFASKKEGLGLREEIPKRVKGPIKKGQKLGSITFIKGDGRLIKVDLVAAAASNEPGFVAKLPYNLFKALLLLLVVVILQWALRVAVRLFRSQPDVTNDDQ